MAITAINGTQVSSPQVNVKNNKKTVSNIQYNNKLEKSPNGDSVTISNKNKKPSVLEQLLVGCAIGAGILLIMNAISSKGERMSPERIGVIADSVTDDCILGF